MTVVLEMAVIAHFAQAPLTTSAPKWHMFTPQLSALWVPNARAAKPKTDQNSRPCFTTCPPKKIKASGQ